VAHAGRTVGSIYAFSTLGAIVGTFAAGFLLISTFGTSLLLLIIGVILALLAVWIGDILRDPVMLFATGILCGAAVAGAYTLRSDATQNYNLETNYYAIRVKVSFPQADIMKKELILDRLNHSTIRYTPLEVKQLDGTTIQQWVRDPLYLHYKHEEIQGEFVRQALHNRDGKPTEVVVIGGGGYTFPYYCETQFADRVSMDVVEIDPGVTKIAQDKLDLPLDTRIRSHHLDGRQFIAERAQKGHYDLVMQDAVNDLSVPYHLMTKEYNDAVKAVLRKDGVYMLTIIDSLESGLLWRSAVKTLRETFTHVTLLHTEENWDSRGRNIYVIYASNQPFDLGKLSAIVQADGIEDIWTHQIPDDKLEELLQAKYAPVLTDQFAPVDNLMAQVFKDRN